MSIYKECDIRGIYGTELTDSDAYNIGRAVGTILAGRDTVVGGDVRLSTETLKAELIRGLVDCGATVYDIGTVPTPVMYFAHKHLGAYAGLTVTASHNPPQYNGMKLMFGSVPVTPEDIGQIEKIVRENAYVYGQGRVEKREIMQAYADSICGRFAPAGIRIVLDCCDGASSLIAPQVAKRLGCEVTELFCGVDGSFPNRNPNPSNYSNLTALQEKVREVHADLGAAFDGDGDRVVFCDERGEIVNGEETLVLLMRDLMQAGDSFVYDQKSSSIVTEEAERLGVEAIMERSGHAFIKKRFLERGSALAGEISGHFFFGELGYDDGLFAAMLVADLVKRSGKKLSELYADLPKKRITPDYRIRVKYADQQPILDRIEHCAAEYKINRLDGVRVETPDGWMLIRKSVTEEAMTVRMEARDEKTLRAQAAMLSRWVPEFAEKLNTI